MKMSHERHHVETPLRYTMNIRLDDTPWLTSSEKTSIKDTGLYKTKCEAETKHP